MKKITVFLGEAKDDRVGKSTNILGHRTNNEYKEYISSKTLYKTYAEQYFSILNENNELAKAIYAAIDETNDLFNVFYKNNIACYITGQMVGKIIETNLAKQLSNINGFKFVQTRSDKSEKDFECISTPNLDNENYNIDKINTKTPKFFSIELKCTKGNQVAGSRSYAADLTKSKEKSSFYILIYYEMPNLPDTFDDIESEENYKFHINHRTVKAKFCYLEQTDWWYSTGGASSLKETILNANGRFINIIP